MPTTEQIYVPWELDPSTPNEIYHFTIDRLSAPAYATRLKISPGARLLYFILCDEALDAIIPALRKRIFNPEILSGDKEGFRDFLITLITEIRAQFCKAYHIG